MTSGTCTGACPKYITKWRDGWGTVYDGMRMGRAFIACGMMVMNEMLLWYKSKGELRATTIKNTQICLYVTNIRSLHMDH